MVNNSLVSSMVSYGKCARARENDGVNERDFSIEKISRCDLRDVSLSLDSFIDSGVDTLTDIGLGNEDQGYGILAAMKMVKNTLKR